MAQTLTKGITPHTIYSIAHHGDYIPMAFSWNFKNPPPSKVATMEMHSSWEPHLVHHHAPFRKHTLKSHQALEFDMI